MSNNISQNDAQLNKLFESVNADTPDLSRDEILKLITEKQDRKAAPIVPTQKKTVHQLRNGILLMLGILGIATIVYFAFFTVGTSVRSSASGQNQQQQNRPSTAQSHDVSDRIVKAQGGEAGLQSPARRKVIDSALRKPLAYKPIEFTNYLPVRLPAPMLPALGLKVEDDDYYEFAHHTFKIRFPTQTKSIQVKNPNAEEFGQGLHPVYATDAQGRLLMHYEVTKIKGGTSYMMNLVDNIPSVLPEYNYYGMVTMSSFDAKCDSTTGIMTERFRSTAGLFKLDTILKCLCGELKSLIPVKQALVRDLVAKDSTLKVGLGGERQLTLKYQFDLINDRDPGTLGAKRIIDSIDALGLAEYGALQAKYMALDNYKWLAPDLTTKLRIEQYNRKIEHRFYLLKHQKDEAERQSLPLIPIQIRESKRMKIDGNYDDGLIFWYRPSPELDSLLTRLGIADRDKPEVHGIELNASPNPANLFLQLDYALDRTGEVVARLVDLTGRTILKDTWTAASIQGRRELLLHDVSPGIYLLVLESGKGTATRQIVVSR